MAVSTPAVRARRRSRLFYVGMALAITVTVFAGFSRTYFLKAQYGTPELSLLLHVHGLVFTTWVLFFLAQTTLVAAGRTNIHRRMGVAGAVLAALVLIVGTATAIIRVKGGSAPIPGVPPLAFLAVPLFDMVVFAVLVGAALYFRHRAETHKRLMTLGMIALLSAPIARLPFEFMKMGPPAFFGLTDLFIVALVVYDLATWKHIHRHLVGWAADRGLATAAADDLGNCGVDSVRRLDHPVIVLAVAEEVMGYGLPPRTRAFTSS